MNSKFSEMLIRPNKCSPGRRRAKKKKHFFKLSLVAPEAKTAAAAKTTPSYFFPSYFLFLLFYSIATQWSSFRLWCQTNEAPEQQFQSCLLSSSLYQHCHDWEIKIFLFMSLLSATVWLLLAFIGEKNNHKVFQ